MSSEQTWNLPVAAFDDLLLTMFRRYAELLKKRFRDDFQEVIYYICFPRTECNS